MDLKFRRQGPLYIPEHDPVRRYSPEDLRRYKQYRERHRSPKLAWAHVQSIASASATGSTIFGTYGSDVTAGNLLICCASFGDASAAITATCADSLSQNYSVAVGPTRNANMLGGWTNYIFYFPNTAGGANTVTVTASDVLSFRRITILEYSGIATTSPLDVVAGASGNSSAPDSGTNTTTQANDLIFGYCLGFANISAGGGFTGRANLNANDESEDKDGASAGSYSAAFSGSGADEWIAQMAAFKQAAAAATKSFPHSSENNLGNLMMR